MRERKITERHRDMDRGRERRNYRVNEKNLTFPKRNYPAKHMFLGYEAKQQKEASIHLLSIHSYVQF